MNEGNWRKVHGEVKLLQKQEEASSREWAPWRSANANCSIGRMDWSSQFVLCCGPGVDTSRRPIGLCSAWHASQQLDQQHFGPGGVGFCGGWRGHGGQRRDTGYLPPG